MLCWSCRKEIPQAAKNCPHCEAEVEPEPTPEDMAGVAEVLSGMGPELLQQLREAFEQSESGEEFINRVMVGDCPKCESSDTGDCENDPEIDDPCVGRCYVCGHLWCLDCGEPFENVATATAHDCPAWEDMDDEELG